MARKYELRRRAERQDETRQRIVEAAVALHTTLGPARTSVSAIAEKAGVQRHTFYRHFPDERSLIVACSGLFEQQAPLPDPGPWRRIAGAERRLRRGLGELYEYYDRWGTALAPIVRDAADHKLTREALDLRMKPAMIAIRSVLSEPFEARGRALARLEAALETFMGFETWRTTSHLGHDEAIEIAVRAICAQQ
jgi:AcrR family transcriptional regulator